MFFSAKNQTCFDVHDMAPTPGFENESNPPGRRSISASGIPRTYGNFVVFARKNEPR
jgi:hypothetical protein